MNIRIKKSTYTAIKHYMIINKRPLSKRGEVITEILAKHVGWEGLNLYDKHPPLLNGECLALSFNHEFYALLVAKCKSVTTKSLQNYINNLLVYVFVQHPEYPYDEHPYLMRTYKFKKYEGQFEQKLDEYFNNLYKTEEE